MKNLIPIIGKAPSELTPEEFKLLLSKERDRVRKAIMTFLSQPKPSTRKRSPSKAKLSKKLKEAGISVEELEQMLKEQKNA